MTHEDFTRKELGGSSSDRSFGWVFTVFFLLTAVWPLVHGKPVRLWALAASLIVAVVTGLRPSLLHPANRAWTKLGILLGRITNPVVTGLLFFLVIAPTGFFLRRKNKDPLRLRFDPHASSYWIERTPPGPAPESMSRQF